MWDEKTVENIAPTNSVRTPYELTVGKLNSGELRRTPTNWPVKNLDQEVCAKSLRENTVDLHVVWRFFA